MSRGVMQIFAPTHAPLPLSQMNLAPIPTNFGTASYGVREHAHDPVHQFWTLRTNEEIYEFLLRCMLLSIGIVINPRQAKM